MIRAWLILSAFMVVLMIAVGGLTRLTDSGLSITEWKPITGWLPPLSEEAWNIEFANYEQSPEFQKINFNFTIEDFKSIFWLEFIHRLLGRLTGLIIILPYLFFALTGSLKKHKQYLLMCGLVIFQGFLGWYMVKSGLKDNPFVSHWRLAAHLLTAIALYMVILWEVFGEGVLHPSVILREHEMQPSGPQETNNAPEQASHLHKQNPNGRTLFAFAQANSLRVTIILLLIQITLGAMVAGLDAGLLYNEFPLMGGSYVPEEFILSWQMFNDPASLQFLHRNMAYVVTIAIIWLGVRIYKYSWHISYLLVVTISVQVFLGIITLLYIVPIKFALLHQLFAVLCLSIILYIKRFYDRI